MYSYKLKSHENTLLIDHLKFVGDRASDLISEKNLLFKFEKNLLIKLARVMGYTHDLGKSTTYFQQYLDEMIKNNKSKVDLQLKSHANISALIFYYNFKKVNKELAIIGYIAIKHHHGNLKNFSDEADITSLDIKQEQKLITSQFKSLNKEIKIICSEFDLNLPTLNEILELIEDVYEEIDCYNDELEDNKNCETYILFKFIFSLLIYADKEHAIFKYKNEIEYNIPVNLIDEYKLKKFKNSSKEDIRNIVYDDVIDSIKSTDERIMSITLPTGTGKTLASMSVALNLKEKLNNKMKIIYCLPFTSVIDQNFDDYSNAIEKVTNKKATSEQLLKHHYLSSYNYIKSDFYFEGDEGRFLTQNWNSQIVVTTFIQFFNTVFSNNNSELIKFNTLANSIVLLDEVQAIPYKYWDIINNLFTEISNKLNMYFVFITATQPLIFDKSDIKELAKKSYSYFKQYKRTKLIVNEEPMEKEEFFNFSRNIIEKNPNKNILIIVNTIKLSQELFEELNKSNYDREMIYLSTSIIPKKRKARINYINKNKKKKIIISTQMVEAGVDIDMDIVIRDLAPLDSINQSAGRANRENRGEYLGEVYLVKIQQNKKNLASFVYKDIVLLPATEKVLKGKKIILEEDYKNISDSYFNELKLNSSKNISKQLNDGIKTLQFDYVANSFKLIEEQEKFSLFIELDEEAKEVWKKYNEFKNIKDRNIRKNKMDSIKSKFYDYVISVFKNKCKENITDSIVYISINELKNTYDENFGYKVIESTSIIL
ncbi:CRISPR-associated helicase Cas3' [Clostridium tarantellae]|uniref:CRISPR-associated helicase Cas3 n=1 Tax=Clostridium tarantellae TaxID=39493 RepID=A0A6I1MJE3_9CLOT|nr:CRISPR-associated helicase Cas3' [Clostridium tarantellae]MPQ43646.1 CRISPR-associated helicase Cas3' [Clostridium tarantellae]